MVTLITACGMVRVSAVIQRLKFSNTCSVSNTARSLHTFGKGFHHHDLARVCSDYITDHLIGGLGLQPGSEPLSLGVVHGVWSDWSHLMPLLTSWINLKSGMHTLPYMVTISHLTLVTWWLVNVNCWGNNNWPEIMLTLMSLLNRARFHSLWLRGHEPHRRTSDPTS